MPDAGKITIRPLHGMAELEACSAIERAVWGDEVVPAHLLRAVTHMGGIAVGAFHGGELVGFTFGFLGSREHDGRTQLLHHSHVLAVLPAFRGRGIGVRLKRHQAAMCRERGLRLMTWTFDPLRARNAHLNIERLGAVVRQYEPHYYGVMHDSQNGGLDSDRLLAEWELSGEPARWDGDTNVLPAVLDELEDGSPSGPLLDLDESAVHLRVPRDLGALLTEAPETAAAWRRSTRTVFLHYLERRYAATRFLDGGYVLTRA